MNCPIRLRRPLRNRALGSQLGLYESPPILGILDLNHLRISLKAFFRILFF